MTNGLGINNSNRPQSGQDKASQFATRNGPPVRQRASDALSQKSSNQTEPSLQSIKDGLAGLLAGDSRKDKGDFTIPAHRPETKDIASSQEQAQQMQCQQADEASELEKQQVAAYSKQINTQMAIQNSITSMMKSIVDNMFKMIDNMSAIRQLGMDKMNQAFDAQQKAAQEQEKERQRATKSQ